MTNQKAAIGSPRLQSWEDVTLSSIIAKWGVRDLNVEFKSDTQQPTI